MDELDHIISGRAPDPRSAAQQTPASQRAADPTARPAASLLDTLEHVSISSTAAPAAARRTAARPGPPPKQHQAMQQVPDHIKATSSLQSRRPAGPKPDLDRAPHRYCTDASPQPPTLACQCNSLLQAQVWDDLFADAGATSHAHGGAPPGSSAVQADVKRWFAEADADSDGRQVALAPTALSA
jgi:hypothetical protein